VFKYCWCIVVKLRTVAGIGHNIPDKTRGAIHYIALTPFAALHKLAVIFVGEVKLTTLGIV